VRYDPSRSSKVIDLYVIWKPICDVLLVINGINLGSILHRLATVHPWQMDGRQTEWRTNGQTTPRQRADLQDYSLTVGPEMPSVILTIFPQRFGSSIWGPKCGGSVSWNLNLLVRCQTVRTIRLRTTRKCSRFWPCRSMTESPMHISRDWSGTKQSVGDGTASAEKWKPSQAYLADATYSRT